MNLYSLIHFLIDTKNLFNLIDAKSDDILILFF